jgi:hypothetical protein
MIQAPRAQNYIAEESSMDIRIDSGDTCILRLDRRVAEELALALAIALGGAGASDAMWGKGKGKTNGKSDDEYGKGMDWMSGKGMGDMYGKDMGEKYGTGTGQMYLTGTGDTYDYANEMGGHDDGKSGGKSAGGGNGY